METTKDANPLAHAPELSRLVELIFSRNPLQKKRISKYFENHADAEFWAFAESLSSTLNHGFLSSDEQREKATSSYIQMCKNFLWEQIKFKKTGKYSCHDASVANIEVYSDPEVMRYYMVGLLLSYIFWPNHYELFKFFKENLPNKKPQNYLEVGVGHGLFTSTILKKFAGINPTIVDISETSINTSKEVMKSFNVNPSLINFVHSDYLDVQFKNTFDFITMGEVLEHVNDAPLFMRKTKELLSSQGRIYLSTCANSPALDHVYHFHNVQGIRNLLIEEGFHIVKDLALAAEDIPEEEWEKELVTINYCAILEHKK